MTADTVSIDDVADAGMYERIESAIRSTARDTDILPGTPLVHAAYVFGSLPRGEGTPDSDLDLMVAVSCREASPSERREFGAEVAERHGDDILADAGISDVDIGCVPPASFSRLIEDAARSPHDTVFDVAARERMPAAEAEPH